MQARVGLRLEIRETGRTRSARKKRNHQRSPPLPFVQVLSPACREGAEPLEGGTKAKKKKKDAPSENKEPLPVPCFL